MDTVNKTNNELLILLEKYKNVLREIDAHIRSDKEPVPYIIETLKEVLPEYK